MASGLSDDEKKVVMAFELSEDDSHPASLHRKCTTQGDTSGNPSMTPTKRQKTVGEQEVHHLVPQGEPLAEEDGRLGSNAAESEPGTTEESLKGRDGKGNADGTTGNQEEKNAGKVAPVAKATDPADVRRVADEFHVLTRLLRDLLERLKGRNKEDVEKALFKAEALELMCGPGGSYQPPPSNTIGGPNHLRGKISQLGSPVAFAAARKKERDIDAPSSSTSTSDDDSTWRDLDAPASVSQRQKNDPELREKIQKVETDYWEHRISREVYNEERFKLYTEEEAKEARIVWPLKKHGKKKCYSPAGFVEAVFDQYDRTEDGPDWQTRMDFHYPEALSPTDTGEENLCELCVPLIEKHRDFLKAERREMEEVEAMQEAAAREKEKVSWEELQAKWLAERKETERKGQEKALAKQKGPPCPECNKKFATESALKAHTAAKHKK